MPESAAVVLAVAMERELRFYFEAAACGGADGERGVVGVGDGRDDGEAESGASAGAVCFESFEGAQRLADVTGIDDRPAVGRRRWVRDEGTSVRSPEFRCRRAPFGLSELETQPEA